METGYNRAAEALYEIIGMEPYGAEICAYINGGKAPGAGALTGFGGRRADSAEFHPFAAAVFENTAGEAGRELLTRAITLYLSAENYAGLFRFVCYSIINNPYGREKYTSTSRPAGSPEERYFDRFVEMLLYCGISDRLYFPMMVRLLAPSSLWRDFAAEFVIRAAQKDYDAALGYIDKSPEIYSGFEALLKADFSKTFEIILTRIFYEPRHNKAEYRELLKKHKGAVLERVFPLVADGRADVRENALRLVFMYKNDEYVRQRLFAEYAAEPSKKLRRLYEKELGLEESIPEFSSAEEIKAYAGKRRGVSLVRLPKLFYADGSPVQPILIKDMIYFSAKGKAAAGATKSCARFLQPESLQIFTGSLISAEKDITHMRRCFAAVFADGEGLNKIINYITEALILGGKKAKEAQYLITVLGYNDSPAAREYLLTGVKGGAKPVVKAATEALSLSAARKGAGLDDFLDAGVPGYGLMPDGSRIFMVADRYYTLKISDRLETLFSTENEKGQTVPVNPKYIEARGRAGREMLAELRRTARAVKKELSVQSSRFYDAFMTFRVWSGAQFKKNVLGNPILEKVAASLFWGVYHGGSLRDVFIVHDNSTCDLSNIPFTLADGAAVAIAHPSEMDSRFNFLFGLSQWQPFNQLNRAQTALGADDLSHTFIARFKGSVIRADLLAAGLKEEGYRAGEKDVGGKTRTFNKLISGLLCVVDFDGVDLKQKEFTALNHITFYDRREVSRSLSGFNTDGAQGIPIKHVPARFACEAVASVMRALGKTPQ